MYIDLNKQEQIELMGAQKAHKFGALKSWKLLVAYQASCRDVVQFQQIAGWAKRKRMGEAVTLPLMKYELDRDKTR